MVVCAVSALVLAATGCGAQEHTNEPRRQPPTRVSVSIGKSAVTVQPPQIAFGHEPTQQIPQNQRAGQPAIRSKTPLDVTFVAANLTAFETHLEVRGPRIDATSKPLIANGAVTLQTSLPTGVYTVSAPGVPGASPGRLTVGPYRSSSRNDLLLP